MAIAFSHAGSGSVKAGTTASATVTINAGDTVVIGIAILANTSPTSVVDSGGSVYKFRRAINNGASVRVELWTTDAGAAKAATSVTVQFAAATTYVVNVSTYTGVLDLGNIGTNSGASTAPALTLITQDPNNWIAMAVSANGIGTFSATAPNVIRTSAVTAGGSAATNQGGAEADAGAFATIGNNTVTGTLSTSETWATVGIELRSVSLAYSYLCGFEMNSLGEFNTTGGTAPTIQSGTVHGGSFAMRCHPTAAASFVQLKQIQGPAAQPSAIFCSVRFYMNIAVLPNVNTAIYSGANGVISGFQTLQLNTDGSLTISDGVGASATSTLKLATGAWRQISLAVNPIDGSNFIAVYVDGTLWAQLTSTPTNTIVYDTAQLGVGVLNSSTPTCDIYFDDVLFTNDFAYIGPGSQVLLLPTADSAIGNWTAGAGGVTNLWQGVDNIPPVGKAAGSETNTTQIRNPNATVPSDYVATCQSYSAKGIAAGSSINALTAIVADGVEVAATTFGFTFVASNPTQTPPPTQFEFRYGTGAGQGTFPTTWDVDEGPVTTNPTVVLGTAPTVTLRKLTGVVTADDACFLGIYVDYITPVTVNKVHSADVDIQALQSKSHSADVDIQALQASNHSADVDILVTGAKTHAADVDILVAGSSLHSADVDIQTTSNKIHSADVDIQVDQSKLHSADIVIQVVQNKLHSADVDIQVAGNTTHSADVFILLQGATNSTTHSADVFIVTTAVQRAFLPLEIQGYHIQLIDNGDNTAMITTTTTQGPNDVTIEEQGFRLLLHPTGNFFPIGGIPVALYAVVVSSV